MGPARSSLPPVQVASSLKVPGAVSVAAAQALAPPAPPRRHLGPGAPPNGVVQWRWPGLGASGRPGGPPPWGRQAKWKKGPTPSRVGAPGAPAAAIISAAKSAANPHANGAEDLLP